MPVLDFHMACSSIFISAYLCWRENYETHDDGEYVKLHSVSAYKVEQIYFFQKFHKTWRKFSKSIVTIEIFINILLPTTQLSWCSKALLRNRTRRLLAGEEYFFSAATLRRVSAQIILTSSHQYSIPIGVITNMSLCKVPSDHARGELFFLINFGYACVCSNTEFICSALEGMLLKFRTADTLHFLLTTRNRNWTT